MKEKELTQTFFEERTVDYSAFAFGRNTSEVRQRIKWIIDEKIQGKVIDLGGGGEIHYEIGKANPFVSFDISWKALRKVTNTQGVYAVCGDAENLPFKSNIFDVTLCRCFIHHLVGGNIRRSDQFLLKILAQIFKITERGGQIVIIENCLPEFFEKIQDFLFLVLKKMLELFGKPMVRFLSPRKIDILLRNTGFREVQIVQMKEKRGWQFISVGIILPFFKIPQKIVPTTHHIVTGRKP